MKKGKIVTGLFSECPICGKAFCMRIEMLGVVTVILCGGGHSFVRQPIMALMNEQTPFEYKPELNTNLFEKKKGRPKKRAHLI